MKKRKAKPEAAARKRTARAKHATAVPIPDRHMICPGSGLVHAQVFLRVMQGESYKFIRCPIPECKIACYYGSDKWDEPAFDFGLTREQIMKLNPEALIL